MSSLPPTNQHYRHNHLQSPMSDAERELLDAIRGLSFGSVEVTIHDSRIVQIERKEKRRFA